MVELLAPAGSFETAQIAIENGADSLYAGLKNLSLRPRRAEFLKSDFKNLVNLAHSNEKKIYAVLNVFLKQEDLDLFKEEVAEIYQAGADGVMVADVGAIKYIQKNYPELPIHISVQTSVVNVEAAKFYTDLGAKVIVISRSLDDLDEVAAIVKSNPRVKWEVFIHGGICYHYDGSCFLSSYYKQEKIFDELLGKERLLGQNNATGECHLICKRECTLSKNGQEIASGRLLRRPDLVGLSNLPRYIKMGIEIFKIEGRAMPLSYVAQAVRLYRQAIDLYLREPSKYRIREEWHESLENLLEARLEYERKWHIHPTETSSHKLAS